MHMVVFEQAAPTCASAVLPLWVFGRIKESAVVPFYEPAARLCSSATFMCYAPERATLACDRQYDGYRSSGVWQFRRL